MKGVAFLCVANSARSPMAEGVARSALPSSVRVYSAGSVPGGAVHELAVRVMAEIGLDISGHRPKPLEALPLDEIDTAVTLCAEEVCPVLPGAVRRLHWPLPDPAAVAGDAEAKLGAFRAARDEIRRRIEELPIPGE